MNTYTHLQGLLRLPPDLIGPGVAVSYAIPWDSNCKVFNAKKHMANWLVYLASKYEQDEDWFCNQIYTLIDNGYFEKVKVGDGYEFGLRRSLPDGEN